MSLSNPAFRLILGDFNCRSNFQWQGDISTTEDIDLESVSSSHGLHQLITDPTHILSQSSSCIDLIFIDQPNLVIDSGVHSHLHANCPHQIIHCKLNLEIVFPLHMSAQSGITKKLTLLQLEKHQILLTGTLLFLTKPFMTTSFDDQDPPGCMTSLSQKSNKKTLFLSNILRTTKLHMTTKAYNLE